MKTRYSFIWHINLLYLSQELKEKLDADVIYSNLEYRELTKKFAQAFNDMMAKEIKRHTDFFLSPGIEHINTNWDMYVKILKGLPMSIIDTLDEDCWEAILNEKEKNHNGGQFKREFLRKRDEQRNAQRKKEQEIADSEYWASHPEELKKVEGNKKKIAENRTKVDEMLKEISSLESDKHQLEQKKSIIEDGISDKEQQIEKLGKKIFGKKKAEEETHILKDEIDKLRQELQVLYEQIETIENPISKKQLEKSNLEREIRGLEQENVDLRNM